MYKLLKPQLTVEQQIQHLEAKGIKFTIFSKDAATKYLTENNNYFKLTSYRKSFAKHPDGKLINQYIDLDFELLKDLAIIDMRIRYSLLHMALDIEHFSKVRLLKFIENSQEDGYQIVEAYIESLSQEQCTIFRKELERVNGNPYCGDIISKYNNELPVWAFVEIITLGRFISFYRFCAHTIFNNKKLINEFYLLSTVKDIRNATAHNNCVINNLYSKTSTYTTSYEVTNALRSIGISKDICDRKMSNARVQQIVTLLYSHKLFVTSSGVYTHQCEVLQDTITRMFRNIKYYTTNETITTNFDFLKKVVDNWYPKR